jgi:MFS family permease
MAVLPLAFGILREHAEDGREVNLGVGLLAGVYAFGVGLGAVLGGLIVDNRPWQQIFLVSAAAAALALVLVWQAARARPGRRPDGPLDLLGGASVVLPIVAILLGLSNARTTGWNEPSVWGFIAAGAAGLGVWVRHELRQPYPLINLRQFKVPQIAIVNTLAFVTALGALNYAPIILPMLQQPLWTGVGLGVTATLAGLLKLLTNLTCTAAAFGAGYASRRRGMRHMVLLGAVANVIGWGALVVMHDSLFAVIAICVLFIAPAGTLIVAGCSAIIIEATPEDRTSEATGLTQVLRSIALGMGAVITGLVLSNSSISNGGQTYPDEQAYMTVFVVMAFGSVAA